MQIIDRGGVLNVKLLQAESRRLRDAVYMARRIARNISDEALAKQLNDGADAMFKSVELFSTPATAKKQDAQDQETPPAGVVK